MRREGNRSDRKRERNDGDWDAFFPGAKALGSRSVPLFISI